MIYPLILTSFAAGAIPAPNWIAPGVPYIHIIHVQPFGPEFQNSAKSRANYVAEVNVDGTVFATRGVGLENGYSDWRIPLDTSKRDNRISIWVYEEPKNGSGERKVVNVSPTGYHKNLDFIYDRETGKFYGDTAGRINKPTMAYGRGGDAKAVVTFEVTKSW